MRRALVLAAWLYALPAHAHQLGVTYIDVTEDGDTLDIAVALDPHDTPLASHVDSDGDGIMSPDELAASEQALVAFTFGRIGASRITALCTHEPAVVVPNELGIWQGRAHYRCDGPAVAAHVHFRFLAAMPSGHRAIVRVTHGGVLREAVTLTPTDLVLLPLERNWVAELGAYFLWLAVALVALGLGYTAVRVTRRR